MAVLVAAGIGLFDLQPSLSANPLDHKKVSLIDLFGNEPLSDSVKREALSSADSIFKHYNLNTSQRKAASGLMDNILEAFPSHPLSDVRVNVDFTSLPANEHVLMAPWLIPLIIIILLPDPTDLLIDPPYAYAPEIPRWPDGGRQECEAAITRPYTITIDGIQQDDELTNEEKISLICALLRQFRQNPITAECRLPTQDQILINHCFPDI